MSASKFTPVVWLTKGHGSKLHLAVRGATVTLCGLSFDRHVRWHEHTGDCARCAKRAREWTGR